MMNNKNSTVTNEGELRAWEADYRLYRELELERVKTLPEFQEWAATVINEGHQTEDGWIPGWTIDDCARKWVNHYGFDFAAPPIELPQWPAVTQDIDCYPSETEIYTSSTIELGEGRKIMLSAMTNVNLDGPAVTDQSATIQGFTETLVVSGSEIDDVIAALFRARQFLTGHDLAE